MADMAPALTEAATQVRAKLPKTDNLQGGLATLISPGRLEETCPSPSPISEVLLSPTATVSTNTQQGVAHIGPQPGLVGTKNLVPVIKKACLVSGKTQPVVDQSLTSVVTGIRRVNNTDTNNLVRNKPQSNISTCSSTPASTTAGLHQTAAALQAADRAKAAAAKLSNLAAAVRNSGISQGHLVAATVNPKPPQVQRSPLASDVTGRSNIGVVRPSGSGIRTGELLLLKTVDRMNQQKPTTLLSVHNQTGTGSNNKVGNSGQKMPHPAAAPNIQTNRPQAGMGYTFKTSTSTPKSNPQQQGAPSASSGGPGGVAPSTSGATNTNQQPSTSGMSDSGSNLQTMEDLASVTLVEIQSVNNSGMADVGLLNNVDRVAETAKRQRDLERHADRLSRRLRRLQSRKTIAHVQHQLSGFVDHQHKNLQTMAKAMKPQPNNSVDLKAELLQSEDVKSLSTAALVSLVRRLQSSQAMTLRQRLANSNQSGTEGSSVLRLDEDLCTEMNRVSSTLQKDMKHLESMLDSDATESSSGGESCDDEYDFDDDKVQKACLRRRAEWRWATERAAVAAKWTWLQAQVSDLEYRIRQQSDIYRQIRAAKGAVVLGEPQPPEDLMSKFRSNVTTGGSTTATTSTPGGRAGRRLSPLEEKIANLERKNEMSPCNLSTLLSNVDKQSSRLTQQLGNVLSPAESPVLPGASGNNKHLTTPPKTPKTQNGFLAGPSGSTTSNTDIKTSDRPLSLSFDPPSPSVDLTCQAARCRPVRSYGKRKLLTTSGLYQLSRKAARLSTVPCNCYPPVVPCAMCGGRYNNTQTVQATVMPVGERVALLDPSYHQVLSFPQDSPLAMHFESLLRCGEWQHKPIPTKPLRPLGSSKGKQKRDSSAGERKYRKNSSTNLLSSAKIRNKYDMKQLQHGGETGKNSTTGETSHGYSKQTPDTKRKRKASLSALEGSRKKRNSMSNSGPPAPSPTTISPRDTPSPLSHSCPTSTLRDMKDAGQRRRRGESAFDINNIVIPYSMAASTRVEKLLYKEIITPKWRKVGQGGDEEVGEEEEEETPEQSVIPTPTATPEQHQDSTPLKPADSDTTNKITTPLPPTPNTPSNPQLSTTSLPHSASSLTTPPSLPDTPLTPETPSFTNPPITQMKTTDSELTPDSVGVTQGKSAPDVLAEGTGPVLKLDNIKEEDSSSTNDIKPSFKIVEPTTGENGHVFASTSAADQEYGSDEDLTDETIAARHMRCEIKEKKRFMSVIKKRSRSSRTDSVSAADDIVLPAADSPSTSDLPSTSSVPPSASSTPPSTPAPTMAPPPQLTALIDEELELSGERRRSGSCSSHEDLPQGRRRSLSGRQRTRGLSASFTSIDDSQDEFYSGVDPWTARDFPLTDTEFDYVVKGSVVMPMVEGGLVTSVSGRPLRHAAAATTTKGGYTYHTATPENSNPTSPIPSSSNSSVMDDDPNDPEWTVVDGAEKEKPVPQQPQQQHTGLVLKLAKR